jgi:YVTN family beta-propeller protein
MRKLALVAALLSAVSTGAAIAAFQGVHGVKGTLWVTDKNLVGTVAAFDAATGALRGIVPVGRTPIGVTVPRGSRTVYVSNEDSQSVSVIGARCLCVTATIPMGLRPHHMMASPNGKLIYVGEFGQNTVGVIDTRTNTEIAHYVTGPVGARTHAVFVSRDGKTLYATEAGIANDVVALDAATGGVVWRLPIGSNPSEALVPRGERVMYVSVRNENAIKVVDLETQAIAAVIPIGPQPDTLQITPDGRTLVVALRGTPAEVSLLDTETHVVRPVLFPGFTSTGHHWLSKDGRYSFVALVPGGVGVVDNETATVVRVDSYPGGLSPHGVFLDSTHQRGDSDDDVEETGGGRDTATRGVLR